MRLRLFVVLGVVLVALIGAGGARAAGNSLSLAANAGATDASGVTITASGSTATTSDTLELFVHYQQGGTCAPDQNDNNPPLDPDSTVLSTTGAAYSFSSSQPNQLLPGSYLVCGWLVDLDTSTVIAHNALPLTVGAADTMTIVFSAPPVQGRSVDVSASGVSYDVASVADATYKPAGGHCAASFPQDSGTPVDGGEGPNPTGHGAYTTEVGAGLLLRPGTYLFCAWLFDQGNGAALKTASTVVNVPALHAAMQLHVPAAVPQGGAYDVSLDVTLDYGVPVTVWADALPKTSHGCPKTPGREPGSVQNIIDDDVQDSQQPTGTLTSTAQSVPVLSNGPQLVCAWVLDAWSINVFPQPIVAGPITATVSVGRPLHFKGHTSQKLSIGLFATPFAKLFQTIQFKVRFRCAATPRFANGQTWNRVATETLSALVLGVIRPDSTGRFKVKLKGPGHTVVLHGRVQGKVIKGSFTDKAKSSVFTANPHQSVQCGSGNVTFTARAP